MNDLSVTWWDDEYYVTLATKPGVSSIPDAPSLEVELLFDVDQGRDPSHYHITPAVSECLLYMSERPHVIVTRFCSTIHTTD